jgi:aminomethyltransferase
MYHPRGYIKPEDGGAMVEYDALVNHVTMWNVAVERQIRVKGPDALKFTNYVITRDASRIEVMNGKYVILCNSKGGVLNDPILLRVAEDEFWFSLSDSDIMFFLQGVNHDKRFNVTIDEIDVCPVQIQGPKSVDLMADLVGDAVRKIPYYGLMEAKVGGRDCIISQTGFTGEKGYEIYLKDATKYADDMWNAVLEAGKKHNLMVIAPAHHRRIAAGILSWGQDLDAETYPFQCNLGYQVPRKKTADYIGKEALEAMRAKIESGEKPYSNQLVGFVLGGKKIEEYAPDFWLVSEDGSTPIGYLTSPWYSPELQTNIAMGYVPYDKKDIGNKFKFHLPDEYCDTPGQPVDGEIVEMPFRPSVNPNAREIAKSQGRDVAF